MNMHRFSIILFVLVLSFLTADSGFCARKGMAKNKTFAPEKTGQVVEPSGLKAKFYDDAACTVISSEYGSPTRYDGSTRPKFRYNGRHGGIDLSLDPGTPLLAIAAGTVVHKAEGRQMEGFFIWLLHTPEETGFDSFVLTKYQHLKSMPEINIGEKVAAGQIIAYSGATGTYGGHYGKNGYPHLHLSTMKSDSGKYMVKDNALVTKAQLFDPLVLFQSAQKRKTGKTVMIPYLDANGNVHPEASRLVWPVSCGE